MTVTRKDVRKLLDQKIVQLNDIIADMDTLLTRMETDFYRVSIFGSARLQPQSELYKAVHELAFQLAMRDVDIVTGGGPGLMDAANKGAKAGGLKTRSIGLAIKLPTEDTNLHLDVKRQHRRFSSRLDEFMRISHAVVVTPGGIGTNLELFYTWQLIQVGHITPRPMILLDRKDMWKDLIEWLHKWPLRMKLISEQDLNYLTVCHSVEDVLACLEPEIGRFHERSPRKRTGTSNAPLI